MTGKPRTFIQAKLPLAQKKSLCRDLLAEFGARNITEHSNGELIHSCCLPFGQHRNGDRNPSASLNYEKLTYSCLTADTLVKTFDGEYPIGELAGRTVKLLDGAGKWVDAPVKHYGQARIYRVTLSRNGVRRVIETTADHRWYIRKPGAYQRGKIANLIEKTTATLRPKDRIPSIWPMVRTGRTTLSSVGVMAGFVYGDGTRTEHGARANFHGDKDTALKPYFSAFEIVDRGRYSQITNGLPRSWKELPSLDEGASYLWGWLAGYFAADGCVAEDGHTTLACHDPDTLRFVVALCDRMGIATYTLGSRDRIGMVSKYRVDPAPSSISWLSFRNSTLTPEFFLIPAHRKRFEEAQQRRRYERTHWWVTSVEETDRIENVYCAEVPTTNSFVLAGNVLTGNCLGCGGSGGLLWFIAVCRGEDVSATRHWLENATGTEGGILDLTSLLRLIDEIFEPKTHVYQPMPTYPPSMLRAWHHPNFHPLLTEGMPEMGIRGWGIPEHTLRHFDVGYDLDTDRITIPVWWKGKLVGWQGRRAYDVDEEDEKEHPKYKSSPGLPKSSILFNYEKRDEYVVVESPKSVLQRYHHIPNMVATFSAKVEDEQKALLHSARKVILWFDNDKAGWSATRKVGNALTRYTNVYAVNNPYDADAGDFTDQVAEHLLATAVPYSVWKIPGSLRRWRPS